jgi:hypothetical protein
MPAMPANRDPFLPVTSNRDGKNKNLSTLLHVTSCVAAFFSTRRDCANESATRSSRLIPAHFDHRVHAGFRQIGLPRFDVSR